VALDMLQPIRANIARITPGHDVNDSSLICVSSTDMAAPDSALSNSEFIRSFITVKGRTLVSRIRWCDGTASLKEAG